MMKSTFSPIPAKKTGAKTPITTSLIFAFVSMRRCGEPPSTIPAASAPMKEWIPMPSVTAAEHSATSTQKVSTWCGRTLASILWMRVFPMVKRKIM